jgi:hypothetical protein
MLSYEVSLLQVGNDNDASATSVSMSPVPEDEVTMTFTEKMGNKLISTHQCLSAFVSYSEDPSPEKLSAFITTYLTPLKITALPEEPHKIVELLNTKVLAPVRNIDLFFIRTKSNKMEYLTPYMELCFNEEEQTYFLEFKRKQLSFTENVRSSFIMASLPPDGEKSIILCSISSYKHVPLFRMAEKLNLLTSQQREQKSVLSAGEAVFNPLGECLYYTNQSGAFQPPSKITLQAKLPCPFNDWDNAPIESSSAESLSAGSTTEHLSLVMFNPAGNGVTKLNNIQLPPKLKASLDSEQENKSRVEIS